LGGLLIGSVTASMLLGHRYLTDTGLTIAPLRRMTKLFLISILVRAVWVGLMVAFTGNLFVEGRGVLTWNLLFFGVRVLVGILGTAVFGYMMWDCVKRRSTQSATGILYLTMVFVFIGELTGHYLLRNASLPV